MRGGVWASVGFIRHRAAADWLVLGAAWTTITLAMTLLASGPIYSEAVTVAAVQRSLQDAPAEQAGVVISSRVDPRALAAADQIVEARVAGAVRGSRHTTHLRVEAGSLGLGRHAARTDRVELARLRYMADIDGHASLVTGAWPSDGADGAQTGRAAAVPVAVADVLGIVPGDTLTLESRTDDDVVPLRIVGVFTIDDADDGFWIDDPLTRRGVEESASFRTRGPFIVSLPTIAAGASRLAASTSRSSQERSRWYGDGPAVERRRC